MQKIRPILYFVIVLILFCSCLKQKQNTKPVVLIVHSYHQEYQWVQAIDRGIKTTLQDYQIFTHFMDTKRNTSEEFKQQAGELAMKKVTELKPQVIIISDDNGQKYLGSRLVGRQDLSIVFCGVNADPKDYGYPGANATGIIERPQIWGTIKLLKEVCPNIESYTLLTDKSPTSDGFISYFKSLDLPINVEQIIQPVTYSEWQEQYQQIKSDAIISYMYHTVQQDGKSMEPGEVMEWTRQHMKKPSVGFLDFTIEDGIMLGKVESGFEHGELAAKMAIEIINGKKSVNIPIIPAKQGLIFINQATTDRLGVDISDIKNIADKIF